MAQFHSFPRLSAFICGSVFCLSSVAQPVSVVDDRGKTVRLPRPAQRIVALAPGLAELAYAAGAGDRLVGTARHSDYPPPVRVLPQVGDAAQVEFERIAALKPDLVLAWKSGNPRADVERLERLGYPVYASEPARLADVPRVLRAVGKLAGTEAAAGASASAFERDIATLREKHAGTARVRVFYQIWHEPLLTVNGSHLISDVLTLCGGVNVFADLVQLTPGVSLEAVLAARPEAVLGGGSAGGAATLTGQWRASPVPRLRELPVHYIDPDLIQRQTPRVVAGARAVCAALEAVRIRRQDTMMPGRSKIPSK